MSFLSHFLLNLSIYAIVCTLKQTHNYVLILNPRLCIEFKLVWVEKIIGLVLVGLKMTSNGYGLSMVLKDKCMNMAKVWFKYETILRFCIYIIHRRCRQEFDVVIWICTVHHGARDFRKTNPRVRLSTTTSPTGVQPNLSSLTRVQCTAFPPPPRRSSSSHLIPGSDEPQRPTGSGWRRRRRR